MRSAWMMKLKPGHEVEYKRKHDEIWPEMVTLLKSQGVYNYSIYRYELLLFAYFLGSQLYAETFWPAHAPEDSQEALPRPSKA